MGCSENCPGCSAADERGGSAHALFEPEAPRELTEAQEVLKRQIYEKMNPRRRKFVDRIGYAQWDPFQAPNDPLDIRTDRTSRTLQELVSEFMRHAGAADKDPAWRRGVMECALGIIKKNEKFQGIFDFCLWYHDLLQREERKP